MGIEATYTSDFISKRFEAFITVVEKRQIERMQMLGEMCVTHAKLIPEEVGYKDRTGNLRGSTGYVIFHDGVAIDEFFEDTQGKGKKWAKDETAKGEEATEGVLIGSEVGRKLAISIGEKTQGIVLVVVAGMNYAIYVEAKGRDVLASAERLAIEELPKMIKDLTENIEKASA